jgi:S-formylglutathione hydrolase FrmB/chitodextrinase
MRSLRQIDPGVELMNDVRAFSAAPRRPHFLAFLLLILSFVLSVPEATYGQATPPMVTKRFGDAGTCDVTGTALDAIIDGDIKSQGSGAEGTFYYRWQWHIIMRYELGSIPAGTPIERAVLRLFYAEDFHDGGKNGVSVPIYRLEDPDATGTWVETEANFNRKRNGVNWSSSGDASTVFGPQIGSIYYKNWYGGSQRVVQADITDAVRYWVDNPGKNLGMIMPPGEFFNKRIASRENGGALLRPYLEITYAAPQDEAIAQASGLDVKHGDGQSFVTWTEVATGRNETGYRIYRHGQPITSANLADAELLDQVYQGSSYLSDSISIRQPDLSPMGIQLAADSGLYVHTAEANEAAYYAVTTVVEGNENRTITPGANATTAAAAESVGLPRPFFLAQHFFGYYTGFVIWLGKFNPTDPSDPHGFDSRPSAPFLFSVAEPMSYSPTRNYPLMLYLHAWGKNYFDSEEGRDNSRYYDDVNYGGYSVAIDDTRRTVARLGDGTLKDIGPFLDTDTFGHSFYTGWNSNYENGGYTQGLIRARGIQKPFEDGVSVPYVEKSIRYVLEWMTNRSPWANQIDSGRIYATGGSMGGSGTLAFTMHNPDLITAANAFLERTALFYQNNYSFNADRQFGTREMAIQTPDGEDVYDYFDIAAYLRNRPGVEYPPIRLYNGKQDTTIPWSTHADFYQAAAEAGLYLVAYWDQGTHASGDSQSDFTEKVSNRFLPRDQSLPYFNPFQFRHNRAYPAFLNFSLNGNPGNGDKNDGDLRGGINRFVRWEIDTQTDNLTVFSTVLYLYDFTPQSSATVTAVPSNLQSLVVAPGAQFGWTNVRVQGGATLQSGTVIADGNGRLVVPGVQVNKLPSRLTLQLQTGGDTIAPSIPTGAAAVAQTAQTALMTWNASTDNVGVAGYRIYLDGGTWLTNATGTSGLVTGLTPGVIYNLRVSAFDASGNESGQSAIAQVTMPGDQSNQPPVLAPIGDREVGRGEFVRFTVSGYDVDDFALQFSADPLPEGAQFNTATREFSWIPNFAQAGDHPIAFRVTDGKATTSELVTITVRPDPPQAQIGEVRTYGAFVSGGVSFKMSNADGNEEGRLYIRRTGEGDTAWRECHPFVRYDANHMASSLFDLEMGEEYDARIELIDPDALNVQVTASFSTRREWTMPTQLLPISVANSSELSEAINAAGAGDHILLGPGTYASNVAVSGRIGQSGFPIVLRAQDPNNRPVLTGGLRVEQSGYIVIHGLELRGGGGIKLRGSHHVEVVDNIVREAGGTVDSYGIHLSHNELISGADQDFHALILNNLIVDDENSNVNLGYGAFPDQTYYGIKLDDGVGGKVIIRGNEIRGVADGIAPGGDEGESPILGPNDFDVAQAWPNNNIDIHDNLIYGVSDDGIETDGHMINGRIFRNTIGYCVNAISCAPVWPGPYFIVRNTLHGFREQSFKLNTAVEGLTRNIFFYHNTVKQKEGTTYCIYRGLPARNQDVVFRNNILESTRRIIDTDIGSNSPCDWFHKNHDFDNDLLWSPLAPSGEFTLFKWGYSDYADNQRFSSLEAFRAGTADPQGFEFTCPDQRVIPQEPNGIFADPRMIASPIEGFAPETYLYNIFPGPDSPAIDAAAPLPGINDVFGGAGPDIGAYEIIGPTPTPTPTPAPEFNTELKPPLRIEYLDMESAPPDSWVTVYGISFGNGPPEGGLYLGDVQITEFRDWKDDRIEFQVPRGVPTGFLTARVGTEVSNGVSFTVRSGATYYVDQRAPNASDANPGTLSQPWLTLDYAARNTSAGDIVYINDGVYEERVSPFRSGNAGRPIVFKARPGARPVMDGESIVGLSEGIYLNLEEIGNIGFVGLTIRNYDTPVLIGSQSSGNRLVDLDVSAGDNGIRLVEAKNLLVAQTRLHNNKYAGMTIQGGSDNIAVVDCVARNNGSIPGGGFKSELQARNLMFRRCSAIDNFGEGFDLQGEYSDVEACHSNGNIYGIQLWRDGSLRNCEVVDNLLKGIALNAIPGNSPSQEVFNCTIAGMHGEAALDVMAGSQARIINTISVSDSGPALRLSVDANEPVMQHSIVATDFSSEGAPIILNGHAMSEAEALALGLTSDSNGNLLEGVDPYGLFRNYGQRDLELRSSSVARDFGMRAGAPTQDILRRERGLITGLFDVGAYEFSIRENAADASWTMYQ